jgi:hypothetical protein
LVPSSPSSGDTAFVAAQAIDGVTPPDLGVVQQRVLASLRADGIAVVPFRDLFDEELWREAVADIEPFVRETEEATRSAGAKPKGKDDVIVRRFFKSDGESPVFGLGSPWLRIGASETVLDIVNSYRGECTRLFYLDNWFTVPYTSAEDRISSQRWHRDGDEEHVVKLFVYVRDVDEDAGPFEYVLGSSSGARHGDVWPWDVKHKRRYPPTEELEAAVPAGDFIRVTGPAGTLIFADTGGFHRGGFAKTKPRVLSIASYVAPGAKKAERRFRVDFEGRESALAAQVRFALS